MAVMRPLLAIALLSACDLEYRETQCMEYEVFVGPAVFESSAAAVGDRFLATWRHGDPGVETSSWSVAVLDRDGLIVEGTEERVDEYRRVVEGGPVVVVVEGPQAYELRDADGAVVGAPIDKGIGNPGVFDGEAFVFALDTTAHRVSTAGIVGPAITLPRPTTPAMATAQITWFVGRTATDTIEAYRLPRASASVDATPRRITDQALFWAAGARATEAVVASEGRDGRVWWHVLADGGAITTTELVVPDVVPPLRIRRVIAERDGYVVVAAGRLLRVTPDGQLRAVTMWGLDYLNHWASADGPAGTLHVFDAHVPAGEAPEIRAAFQPDGSEPLPDTIVVTTTGTSDWTECGGCAATGGSGGPLLGLVVVIPVARRRRRRWGDTCAAR